MASKLALLLCLAMALPASAAEKLLEHPYWKSAVPAAKPPPPDAGITPGETLQYKIYWGIIPVGSSYLRVEKAVDVSSRTVWHLVSEADSNSFIANFYPVADRNESWMDVSNLDSLGYYRKISEGRYFYNEWAVFDRAAGRFYGEEMNRKGKVSAFEGKLDAPVPVSDYLSAVYRLRAEKLSPGDVAQVDVMIKKPLRLTVKARKFQKISTPYGTRKCLLLEPTEGGNGLFVSKSGKRMYVWVTDDELRLPMMLKAEIFIGSVTAKLVKRTITP